MDCVAYLLGCFSSKADALGCHCIAKTRYNFNLLSLCKTTFKAVVYTGIFPLLGEYFESSQAKDNMMEGRTWGSLKELLNGVCILYSFAIENSSQIVCDNNVTADST